ncbi:sugar ABC transporter ATP-binding protein [soil metagenome]
MSIPTLAAVQLRAEGLTKTYGPVTVLKDASISLEGGRVDGLIGRNGAGKSTLVNVLTGRTPADSGTVFIDGVPLEITGPQSALAAGIVAVPQELVMPADMSVTEVVTFGAEPGWGGFLSLGRARRRVLDLLESMGLDIDVSTRVRDLPVSLQKVVLVAQALHRDARVLILDEPTAAMNHEDCDRVLDVVRRLRENGLAILYISHRFDEVEEVCDRVTAMADGRVIDVMEPGEVTHSRLVAAITGAERDLVRPARSREARVHEGDSLVATGLAGGRLRGIDITVAPGELVGIAGLPGSGVEDVFQQLAARQKTGGTIRIGGARITSAYDASRAGVSLLPASRLSASLPSEPVLENLALPALGRFARWGFITVAACRRGAASVIERLSLRPVSERQMAQLSGGNQQRVLVGARLLAKPKFLLLEDPTVGVDIAARAELHELLWSLADEGMGLLVGSSDPEELIGLCDRIVVLRRGNVVADRGAEATTEQELVAEITGSGAQQRS